MKLFHKLALVLLVAGALPVATAGFALVAWNERALEAEVKARFDQTARHAAEAVAADVEGRARMLAKLTAMIDFARLSREERVGALKLLEEQSRARRSRFDAVPAADDATLERIEGRAIAEGPGAVVFAPPSTGSVWAALAVRGGAVALELGLDDAARRLLEVRGAPGPGMWLTDDRGEVLAATEKGRGSPVGAAIQDAIAGKSGAARRIIVGGEGPAPVIGGYTPVGGLGWFVFIEEDIERAFAAPRRMRRLTLLGTAAATAAALAAAFLLAAGLTRRVARLAEAARALGRGELKTRVQGVASDELGQLAGSFNTMADELEKSRAEIERWNRELEQRVEERTAELKAAQAQLVQAQKLAALGQLGAGVAHEINNPLGGVIGHVQLLLASRDEKDPDIEALRHIEEGARRAAQVVQNLLRFSVQHKDPVRTAVDANKLVRDTLTLTETLLKDSGIALEMDLDPQKPRARGDAGQLAQVLLNLVANARTAMPQGGRLTIATRKEASEVALVVSDDGKGIAPEIRDRIFEPFFTTKEEWSNVGLGLSVSYRIVSEHGGRIEVASEPGKGAQFTVRVPA